jgi:hypothetical protein
LIRREEPFVAGILEKAERLGDFWWIYGETLWDLTTINGDLSWLLMG